MCVHTFREVLDADIVKLLDLLHDELLLVDLDDDGGVAGIAAGEAELAEGCLELLGDVDGAGLGWGVQQTRQRSETGLTMVDVSEADGFVAR